MKKFYTILSLFFILIFLSGCDSPQFNSNNENNMNPINENQENLNNETKNSLLENSTNNTELDNSLPNVYMTTDISPE
jgi:hypothetical protein